MNNKKQGKGKGKHFEDLHKDKFKNNAAAEEESVFPGALKKNSYILAKARGGTTWNLGKILDVRRMYESRENKEPWEYDDDEEMVDESGKAKYKYYINYMGLQRRNDRWIPEDEIKIDEEEIERQLTAYEQKQREEKEQKDDFLYNDEHLGLNEKQLHEFEEATKIKTVQFIEIGQHRVETWYFSPFPKEYHCETLYICEYCLHFFVYKNELIRHSERCKTRAPPGDEIYRDDTVSMFELDGKN